MWPPRIAQTLVHPSVGRFKLFESYGSRLSFEVFGLEVQNIEKVGFESKP
jgi:hypothetical protein